MSQKEIAELIHSLRQGNMAAFDKIVLRYQKQIYNLALNYVKSSEEAKDLTQDIFIAVYKALPTLRDESKFTTWFFQVAMNHCRNRYKKLRRRGYFSNKSIDDEESYYEPAGQDEPARNIERQNLQKLVRKVIAEMPESEKEILILRDIQELSYEEVSETLGIPLGTVKSKLNRARSSLKDKLKKFI